MEKGLIWSVDSHKIGDGAQEIPLFCIAWEQFVRDCCSADSKVMDPAVPIFLECALNLLDKPVNKFFLSFHHDTEVILVLVQVVQI